VTYEKLKWQLTIIAGISKKLSTHTREPLGVIASEIESLSILENLLLACLF